MNEHPVHLPMLTLAALISFASINAVLFTPALPDIARYFAIPETKAELTITWYLIAYTCGQLIYGPIANRFGRKTTLYIGIGIAFFSSLLCALSGYVGAFVLLIIGRALLAAGAGVGLKMTYTLVNEVYPLKIAAKKIAYLILSFAIMPGLGVAIGGVLNTHFGWQSCFYASTLYCLLLFVLVFRLPETLAVRDMQAFKLLHLWQGYKIEFNNRNLLVGGLLMGCCTSLIYVFAAITPFLAIDLMGMTSSQYGFANLLPPIALVCGSLASATLINNFSLRGLIPVGIGIAVLGVVLMFVFYLLHTGPILYIFIPVMITYFGACFLIGNTSSIAMSHVHDKSHASAVMSFLNMATATAFVLALNFWPITPFLLPCTYLLIILIMLGLFTLSGFGVEEEKHAL